MDRSVIVQPPMEDEPSKEGVPLMTSPGLLLLTPAGYSAF